MDCGSITIDGVDIATVPRREIRSRLNTMPQDPFLLHGTIRYNIDPARIASDEDIRHILERLHLWDTVAQKGGLNTPLLDGMFSHGQRQILCLARAMVRKGKILIFDEITSR
jgi:ATP-binding cassette, subfamily C (CFTR/MRP), member 1